MTWAHDSQMKFLVTTLLTVHCGDLLRMYVTRFGLVWTTTTASSSTMPMTSHHYQLHAPLRSTPSSSSSSHSFTSKILLLLTVLPVSLAAIAFLLQWRGGITDPSTLLSPHGSHHFPGMDPSPLSPLSHSPSDCVNLGRTSSPSFPYYHNWNLDFGDSLTPKVRFLPSFKKCDHVGCIYFVSFLWAAIWGRRAGFMVGDVVFWVWSRLSLIIFQWTMWVLVYEFMWSVFVNGIGVEISLAISWWE